MKKSLIAYFSATGTTQEVAKELAKCSGGDLFEIQPVIPYSQADLNWMDKKSRSSLEKENPASRPEIKNKVANFDQYDFIFIGFPIWWYVAPNIIHTFLESYDFSDKKIVLFATSGGSGFGKTVEQLKSSVSPSTQFIDELLLNHGLTEEIKQWVESLK